MSDTIDRQAAIDTTWEEPHYTDPLNVLTEVRDRIKALPPAQPEIIHCEECTYRKDNFMGDWCTCWCGWTSLDGYYHKGANKDE